MTNNPTELISLLTKLQVYKYKLQGTTPVLSVFQNVLRDPDTTLKTALVIFGEKKKTPWTSKCYGYPMKVIPWLSKAREKK